MLRRLVVCAPLCFAWHRQEPHLNAILGHLPRKPYQWHGPVNVKRLDLFFILLVRWPWGLVVGL